MKALALLLAWALPASLAAGGESVSKTTLTIKGMTCGGCAAAVKLQLKRTEGVSAYEVSWEKGEAEVTYDPAKTDPKRIAGSVAKTGYTVTVKGDKTTERSQRRAPVSEQREHPLPFGTRG